MWPRPAERWSLSVSAAKTRGQRRPVSLSTGSAAYHWTHSKPTLEGALLKQRLHWLTLHGFVRVIASYGARRGDPQGRLIADPVVKADPVPFYEEMRAGGPLLRGRISYVTADYGVAHEVLRSDDFRTMALGSGLPAPLRWLERRARDPFLHPLRPPSLLAVEPPEHTRYRKTVSSVFTPRAVAALRDRVEETAAVLLDQLAHEQGVVDIVERYCALLPVAIISDILGVPENDQEPHPGIRGARGAQSRCRLDLAAVPTRAARHRRLPFVAC